MSFDSVPSKAEVMSWNAPQLADYLRKMDLGGCDKVIMKCGMNGRRFLSMTDNDVQKFPKIHTPLISKICKEINKKEEKRGFFPKRTVQKYPEPVAVPEDVGWDSEEFDQSDDDYESPDSGGGEGSGGDYESPAEEDPQRGGGDSDNDYEPPPSEPPDELPRQICPAKPLGDSDYIDNTRNRGVSVKVPNNQPPVPPQRPGPGPPQVSLRSTLPGPHPPRREQSPQRPFQLPNRPVPGPSAPQVDRRKKPTTLERGLPCMPPPPERESPLTERKPFGVGERTTPPRNAFRPPAIEKPPEPQRLHKPPIPGPGVSRRVSSVSQHTANSRPFSQDHRNDVPDEEGATFSSNTFPLSARTLPPRPGVPSTPFDSMPPNRPSSSSLPSRLQPGVTVQRSSSRGQADRCPRVPLPPQRPSVPEPQLESEQDLNPRWYVGQATRADAEGSLRQIDQDGAFLVRDSSKGSSTQPYTLMVLYQDKVYNIQIRYNSDEGVFLLGTGFKSSENFPRVNDIIKYHMKMPLLLIDAKDRRSAHQRQCLLTHPAGY